MGNTNYELEDYIYDNRGDFTTTVTTDVEAVISGNITEISKKMTDAAEMGIPVLDIYGFISFSVTGRNIIDFTLSKGDLRLNYN